MASPPDGNPALVKYLGNVPASGKPPAGVLRHRGWRATAVSLPQLNSRAYTTIPSPCSLRRKSKWSSTWPGTPSGSISAPPTAPLRWTEIAGDGTVHLAPIPQLVSANEVAAEPLLPSFLYIPGERDFPPGSIALPWNAEPRFVTGKLAQRRGAEVSSRLVSSAKSWLSYSSVDRTAAMLPWKAAEGVTHISPVDASAEYLKHLRSAWDEEHPDDPFDRAGSPRHRSRILRRSRPRSHRQGRRSRRVPQSHHAGRTAGRVLRVDRAASRLAADRQQRRSGAGCRYRRRHHRFHSDRGHRESRRAATRARRGGRTHPAGRRQYRSCSGSYRRGRPRRQRPEDRRLPATGALEQLPPREGKATRSRIEGRRSSRHHPRQRIEPDRRHDQSQAASRAGGTDSRWLPSRRVEHGHAAARGARVFRRWDCLTRPTRRSPNISRNSCARMAARPTHSHSLQRRSPQCDVRARAATRSAERLARSKGSASNSFPAKI